MTFAPPTGYALSDLADVLCKVVDEDPDDLYDQWVSHEELKELFRSAVTFDRLTHLVETLGLEDDETTLAR